MPAQLISMGIDIAENDASSQLSQRRLEGKVAIITGGARGIGEAAVRLFVMHGAKVVIADIADDAGIALASSLAPSAAYVHCNVTSEEHIKTLIDKTISLFGKLDVFLNNAGVLGDQSKRKSIMDFDSQDFDRVLQVNVRGTALGMKHAAKVMVPRRSGCIISTASVAGFMGGLGPHAYTASKHAIIGLTKNTACELGQYGIRVNCLSPFGVATSMLINAWRSCGVDDEAMNEKCSRTELDTSIFYDHKEAEKMEEFVRGLANLKGVTLKASDIAEAALYLASEESKYVSGHNLVVDGGFTSSINCVGF